MVQKSGYFARSAAANDDDLALIAQCTELAVDAGLRGESGVVGQDEEHADALRVVEFPRIKGGKAFNPDEPWFRELLASIGQPMGDRIDPAH
jgi:pyrophosphate--fructose-6-phosphate 1-phosphotransferase